MFVINSLIYLPSFKTEQKEADESFQCDSHPDKKVELFCSSPSCMKPVCVLCAIDTHKTHECKSIDKAFDLYRYRGVCIYSPFFYSLLMLIFLSYSIYIILVEMNKITNIIVFKNK